MFSRHSKAFLALNVCLFTLDIVKVMHSTGEHLENAEQYSDKHKSHLLGKRIMATLLPPFPE